MDELQKVLSEVLENQNKMKEVMCSMKSNITSLKSQLEKKDTMKSEVGSIFIMQGSGEKLQKDKLNFKRASKAFNKTLNDASFIVKNLSEDIKCLSQIS